MQPRLNSEGLVPCRLSPGWYMIEATPDAESLGHTLIIECFSDKNASISTGKQMMQLGNTRITKRIILCRSAQLLYPPRIRQTDTGQYDASSVIRSPEQTYRL